MGKNNENYKFAKTEFGEEHLSKKFPPKDFPLGEDNDFFSFDIFISINKGSKTFNVGVDNWILDDNATGDFLVNIPFAKIATLFLLYGIVDAETVTGEWNETKTLIRNIDKMSEKKVVGILRKTNRLYLYGKDDLAYKKYGTTDIA